MISIQSGYYSNLKTYKHNKTEIFDFSLRNYHALDNSYESYTTYNKIL